jgi:arginine deiminase
MPFHVDSEVGQLRQVILHRPGLELTRLTPQNVDDLLFDDVMWAQRAREEHDAFAEKLRAKGVKVYLFHDLLAQALDQPGAREFLDV